MSKAALAVTLAAAVAAGTLAATAGARPESAAGPGAKLGIHGEWTIAIRTRRGKLVRRVRFHNDFVGQVALAALLGLRHGLQGWGIVVRDASGKGPCSGSSGPEGCWITGASLHDVVPPGLGYATSSALVVTPDFSTGTVALHGTATAGQADSVAYVATWMGQCDWGAENPCSSHEGMLFTARTLPSAIAVAAGQVIDVTVTLSFANVSS